MSDEIITFLKKHLQAIQENDTKTYNETTAEAKGKTKTQFDLSNLHIQNYDDAAIASYTLLISTASTEGVKVASHNESRVMVKLNGAWKVVHVHKSPAWQAPHIPS